MLVALMGNWQSYFQNLSTKIVGVGVTAFNRCLPAFFVPNYRIVCAKNSLDLPAIAEKCEIMAIERDFDQNVDRLNSLAILKHPGVQKYLKKLGPKVAIFLYKSTQRVEQVCDANGWQIVGNRAAIRDQFEDKLTFRQALIKAGLKPIEGETVSLKDFDERFFKRMQAFYGQDLVLKLAGVTKGGGISVTFASSVADLAKVWQKVRRLSAHYKIETLIVEKKLEAFSPSITGCVTRFGILTGTVQTQIIDIPEVMDISRGSGMFCGHDWSFKHYGGSVQKQAEKICRRFGKYLYEQGYRGLFGVDLLVDKKTNQVYACECNPRFTGAFPVYSMMQFSGGEPPFDAFHLLEHLKIDYQLDFEGVQKLYRQPKSGSQIVLHNKTADWVKVGGKIKAGVYRLIGDELKFVRPGFSYLELKAEEEFVLTDGVPASGELIKPYLRILKIIFPTAILAAGGQRLNPRAKLVAARVYQQLNLIKASGPK